MADHGLLWSDVLTDVPGLLMIQHIAMFPVFLRWTSTAATGGALRPGGGTRAVEFAGAPAVDALAG